MGQIGNEARYVAYRYFIRGKRSRLNSADHHDVVEWHSAALKELASEGIITRRRRPRHADVFLYRGSDESAAIGREYAQRAVPARGEQAPIGPLVRPIESRLVPDPMLTDAEFYHQRRTKSGPTVGKIAAQMSMVEMIGGFARFHDRTEAQEQAAARFLSIYQRAQIGGARAIDYEAVKVDTSGPNSHAEFEMGEEARRRYREVVRYLGMVRSALVESVVVHDVPLRKLASGSRARQRKAQELRDALDDLAVHFLLARKHAA